MTPDAVMHELAEALKDAIGDTPSGSPELDPEEVYTDLACRLILRLAKKRIALVPALARIEQEQAEGARRVLEIFTQWLSGKKEFSYTTGTMPSGKFEIQLRECGMLRAFFMGDSIQDAYAQAAQTISFNGGSL